MRNLLVLFIPSLAKMPSGANAFEISDTQEVETQYVLHLPSRV